MDTMLPGGLRNLSSSFCPTMRKTNLLALLVPILINEYHNHVGHERGPNHAGRE